MSRNSRRISRPLIAILLLSVSLGAGSIIYKVNRTRAAAEAKAAIAAPQENQAPQPGTAASASPAPATQPDLSALVRGSHPIIDSSAAIPAAAPVAPEVEVGPGATTLPSGDVTALLTGAKADIDAGRLLETRRRLNEALQSGQLDDNQAAAAKSLISQISQTVVLGRERFADDPYGGAYVVEPGDSLAKIALAHDTTWEFLSRINGIDPRHLRSGATIKVVQGPFFAVVDKRKFTMDIYLGGLPGEKSSMYVTTYAVGLGRDDSTPIGTWAIEPHRKLKHPTYYSPRGEGVIAADDPKNPLGGYWIGLTGTEGQAVGKMSYGIHGTNEPNSIGKQSSMGCIRMGASDIPVVFDMLVEGKSIVIVKE